MKKTPIFLIVFFMFIGNMKSIYAQEQTLESISAVKDLNEDSNTLKKKHYSEYSHWYTGVEFGFPFFSGDVNSLTNDKTYFGPHLSAHVGYQMNQFLGFKLSGAFGKNKAGAKSYALDYILGPDAMTYYPPTTIEGVKYSEIYSSINYFNLGLHLSLNLNNLVNLNNPNRILTVMLEPAIYMQKFSPTIKSKNDTELTIKDINNSVNIGLGGDLLFRFRLSRLIDLQLGGEIIYIGNNKFDGITTEALAHDSYMWNVKAGIVFKFNGRDRKDNIIYAAPYQAELYNNELLNETMRKLREAESDLKKLKNEIAVVPEPQIIIEEKIIEKEIYKEAQVFPSVYFKRGSSTLEDKLYVRELNEIITILEESPNMNIVVTGYTDHTGSEDSNLQLANKRAMALRDYIVDKGINPNRISIYGYGNDAYTSGQNQYNVLARRASVEMKEIDNIKTK